MEEAACAAEGQGLLEAGGVRIGCGVWFVAWMKKVREGIGEVVVCGKSEGGGVRLGAKEKVEGE